MVESMNVTSGANMEMGSIILDTAIIAAIISAVITIGFLVIREYLIEPRKWKKDSQRITLLKQIEAYGKIVGFLDDAEARRKVWKRTDVSQVTEKHTHLFLLPGHEIQFNQIFRENLAYFSNDIIDFHKTFIENDTDFDFAEKKWKEDQSSWYQGVDLGDMHSLIRIQFNELRDKYQKMTGHSFD